MDIFINIVEVGIAHQINCVIGSLLLMMCIKSALSFSDNVQHFSWSFATALDFFALTDLLIFFIIVCAQPKNILLQYFVVFYFSRTFSSLSYRDDSCTVRKGMYSSKKPGFIHCFLFMLAGII